MASLPLHKPSRLSVDLFRGLLGGRPDEERWELIDGVAVMMTPPTKAHQRIASKLERLLNDALERHDPALAAYQRTGLNLAPQVEHYDPEPDVAVVDADRDNERYSDRFYLAAEIVSSSDADYVQSKREVYKLHDACRAILTVQQERQEVRVDRRTEHGWQEETLNNPENTLTLAEFGLSCKVADLYRGTSLQRRHQRSR